jgi:hypothetical protein
MLRKALTLGMVFILVISLLCFSMVTCFTYDAEAHLIVDCGMHFVCIPGLPCGFIWLCVPVWHTH